jgi:hypothetical protein
MRASLVIVVAVVAVAVITIVTVEVATSKKMVPLHTSSS